LKGQKKNEGLLFNSQVRRKIRNLAGGLVKEKEALRGYKITFYEVRTLKEIGGERGGSLSMHYKMLVGTVCATDREGARTCERGFQRDPDPTGELTKGKN